MKRTYLRPNAKMHVMSYRMPLLLTYSADSSRYVGGGPSEEGVPTVVGETSLDGPDPYTNGQGSGGGGNRSKGFNAWGF